MDDSALFQVLNVPDGRYNEALQKFQLCTLCYGKTNTVFWIVIKGEIQCCVELPSEEQCDKKKGWGIALAIQNPSKIIWRCFLLMCWIPKVESVSSEHYVST